MVILSGLLTKKVAMCTEMQVLNILIMLTPLWAINITVSDYIHILVESWEQSSRVALLEGSNVAKDDTIVALLC